MTEPRHIIRSDQPRFSIIEHGLLTEYTADELSPYAIAVYVALMSYADSNSQAFPSIPKLAERAHVGVTACKAALVRLVELGLLTKEGRAREDTGEQVTNLYTIYRPSVARRRAGVARRPTPSREATHPQSPDDHELDPGELDPLNKSTPNGVQTPSPDDGFIEFWWAYPSRVEKKAALAEWRKLKPDTALRKTILAAIEAQKQGRKWREGIYKAPHRWLKGECWNDEVEPARDALPANARTHAGEQNVDWLGEYAYLAERGKS